MRRPRAVAPDPLGARRARRYPSRMRLRTTILHVDGMRTARCAQLVHTALAGVPGARGAEVVVGRAEVEHEADAEVAAMVDAIASVGYVVTRVTPGARALPLL